MKSPFAKRDEERDVSRRALIKWTVAAGAALGVSRGKIMDILERTAGKETAFQAAESASARSVHLVAAAGGLSWFTLLFPQPKIGAANNANFSYHKPGQGMTITTTDKPYFIGPDTPFATLSSELQMTGFVCGSANAHVTTPNPDNSVSGLGTNNLFAFATALQSSSPSVIPAIAINGVAIGAAQGSAQAANVGKSADVTGLFNSAASRQGGLLYKSKDAAAYGIAYSAFAQLNRAANRSTTKIGYTTSINAAGLLGTNLAAQLQITDADKTRYGVGTGTPNNVNEIAEGLIVAVKAFRMGLTNAIVMPAMNDDPHTAFADGRVNTVPAQLKKIFDAFMGDLTSTTDSVTNESLATDTVITISGDTTKDALSHAGGNWADGTTQGCNQVMVYSAGHLKSGWFGGINTNGSVTGFDPQGNDATYNATQTAKYALASIAYAVAKGDERAISPFANGLGISGTFGRPKQL
ncbi:MAG: hypothetical protein QM831_13045 [Kofleriaceae bacterium]